MRLANLVDDDGVLVLASAVRLRARFADRGFDYEFPNELLAGAAAEEVCAWQTNEPNDVMVAVQVERPAPPEATYLGVIGLEDGDEGAGPPVLAVHDGVRRSARRARGHRWRLRALGGWPRSLRVLGAPRGRRRGLGTARIRGVPLLGRARGSAVARGRGPREMSACQASRRITRAAAPARMSQ